MSATAASSSSVDPVVIAAHCGRGDRFRARAAQPRAEPSIRCGVRNGGAPVAGPVQLQRTGPDDAEGASVVRSRAFADLAKTARSLCQRSACGAVAVAATRARHVPIAGCLGCRQLRRHTRNASTRAHVSSQISRSDRLRHGAAVGPGRPALEAGRWEQAVPSSCRRPPSAPFRQLRYRFIGVVVRRAERGGPSGRLRNEHRYRCASSDGASE